MYQRGLLDISARLFSSENECQKWKFLLFVCMLCIYRHSSRTNDKFRWKNLHCFLLCIINHNFHYIQRGLSDFLFNALFSYSYIPLPSIIYMLNVYSQVHAWNLTTIYILYTTLLHENCHRKWGKFRCTYSARLCM